MIEFVERSDVGRHYLHERRVRLSDAGPDGRLRADGLARYLQDVAGDDWDDTGVTSEDTWVVRRTTVRVAAGGRWPLLGEQVTLTTWCAGWGAAWAERRTDVAVAGETVIECAALWVPIDPTGHPLRLRDEFFQVYAEAAQGRKVSGRVRVVPIPEGAERRPWSFRRADLDIVGHVNNAVQWAPLADIARTQVKYASWIHRGPIEAEDEVVLAFDNAHLWLLVDNSVRVAGEFRVEGAH